MWGCLYPQHPPVKQQVQQVSPHCGSAGGRAWLQVWRWGCSSKPELSLSFLGRIQTWQLSLSIDDPQIHSYWSPHSSQFGGARQRERERSLSQLPVIQPLPHWFHTSTRTHLLLFFLNFLPFPSLESFKSMLSGGLQGCLVTPDQPDAFSSLGWWPYEKAKPHWMVVVPRQEDRSDDFRRGS